MGDILHAVILQLHISLAIYIYLYLSNKVHNVLSNDWYLVYEI